MDTLDKLDEILTELAETGRLLAARDEELRHQRVGRVGEAARLGERRQQHVRLAELVLQQQAVRQPLEQRGGVRLVAQPADEEAVHREEQLVGRPGVGEQDEHDAPRQAERGRVRRGDRRLDARVAVAAAANVFVGMIEAPLLIKPYLKTISRGGLFTLMTTGLSTIAGTVYILYISILSPAIKDAILHLSIASFLSCLTGILVSSILVPVRKFDKEEAPSVNIRRQDSLMMAVFDGISTGINVLMNVIATLIVFLALVYIVNSLLSIIPLGENVTLSLQLFLGYFLAPIMWACGIPWEESVTAGSLMGTKVVFNELMAFVSLAAVDEILFSERSRTICLYALCGFANFGSLAILVGGLTTIVPERKTEVLELSVKSLVAGCLATLLTASVIGVII